MTIILVAAGFFAVALTVIFLFRSAIRRDDELDRRWAEVVEQRAARGDSPSAPEAAAQPTSRGPEEPPGPRATAATPETPPSPQPPERRT